MIRNLILLISLLCLSSVQGAGLADAARNRTCVRRRCGNAGVVQWKSDLTGWNWRSQTLERQGRIDSRRNDDREPRQRKHISHLERRPHN